MAATVDGDQPGAPSELSTSPVPSGKDDPEIEFPSSPPSPNTSEPAILSYIYVFEKPRKRHYDDTVASSSSVLPLHQRAGVLQLVAVTSDHHDHKRHRRYRCDPHLGQSRHHATAASSSNSDTETNNGNNDYDHNETLLFTPHDIGSLEGKNNDIDYVPDYAGFSRSNDDRLPVSLAVCIPSILVC
jgi:hypothetical protein